MYLLMMFYHEQTAMYCKTGTPNEVAGLNLEVVRFVDQEVYSPFEYPEANDWMNGLGRWSIR